MNIGEANDYYALVRGLTPGATDDTMHKALDAAKRLGDKARKALDAGPSGEEVRELVDRNFTILVWGEDVDIELCGPRVETTEAAGGVL